MTSPYPSLPSVGLDVNSHAQMLRLIKETLEVQGRRTTNILDSFVSVRDLVALGFLRVTGNELQRSSPEVLAATLAGTWVNYGSGYASAGYYKDLFGRVHLRGLVRGGGTGTPIFHLPSGYRPGEILQFACMCSDSTEAFYAVGLLQVGGAGNVQAYDASLASSGSGIGWFSLDGVSFLAEQ